jgi:hypothetical protein
MMLRLNVKNVTSPSRLDVFPCVDELVAWQTEGFLLACWQDHVSEARYRPYDSAEYHLQKGRTGAISYQYESIRIAAIFLTPARTRPQTREDVAQPDTT